MISTHECMNTMKRFFITAVLSGLGLLTFAQGEYDVYRYSQVDLLGTSRYMSMAGAFGALGGDMSAVSQNPGGIGVYRSSELSFTPFVGYSTVSSDFNSVARKESKLVGGVNSVGYICSFRPSYSEPSTISILASAIPGPRILAEIRMFRAKIDRIRCLTRSVQTTHVYYP